MRQTSLQVAEVAAIEGLVRVRCLAPGGSALAAEAGQFYLARVEQGRAEPGLLRHPVFAVAAPGGAAFWVSGTHPLAHLRPADALDVVGPCGRGFRWPDRAANVLVLAGSLERVLPAIDSALARGLAVTALTPRSVRLLPSDVEIHRGPVNAELAAWADVVVLDVLDPHARAAHLRALVPPRGPEYIQALLLPPMPCGTGACQACWVQPAPGRRPRLACLDGPVFAIG